MWYTGKSLSDLDRKMATLAYLIRKKEEGTPQVTVNNITKKAPEFIRKTQKNQYIKDTLEALKKKELVINSMLGTGQEVWEITDIGYEWYKRNSKELRILY